MVKVQIVHRTGRKTDLVAEKDFKILDGRYIFKIAQDHYANVPTDSIEILTWEHQPDD